MLRRIDLVIVFHDTKRRRKFDFHIDMDDLDWRSLRIGEFLKKISKTDDPLPGSIADYDFVIEVIEFGDSFLTADEVHEFTHFDFARVTAIKIETFCPDPVSQKWRIVPANARGIFLAAKNGQKRQKN